MPFATVKAQTTKNLLRVLMVTGVYPTEQCPHAGTFIKSQVDSLIAAGLEVEVIHPKPGPSLFRYAWVLLQVIRKTLTGHFDIVHGHYGQWCLLARMQWRSPVVTSFLGNDLLGTPIASGSYTRKGKVEVRISRWLCHHVDAVIVKSEEMKKAAPAGKDISVIPNGVDFELFRPMPRTQVRATLGWDQDRYYILFGNDPGIPRKNFKLAQEAVTRLHGRGIYAELMIANGLPQTKVVQYINASNALILTSISEGSSNIVKETMACNVPIVSTNVGDVFKIIGHTQGCSVCLPDPEVVAEALEQAIRHTEPTTGRADIKHLECSVVAQQVIAVYKQVIDTRTGGTPLL